MLAIGEQQGIADLPTDTNAEARNGLVADETS